jgi:hypothetical protein
MGSGVYLVTAQTPVFAIKYPVVGEPIRTTRQILEDNATAIEAALLSRSATPPGASDLTALAARVTSLEVDPVILQDAGAAVTMTTGSARVSLSPARLVNPLTLFGRAGVGAVCHVQYRALVNTATAGSGSFVDAFLRTASANPTTGVPGGYTDAVQDSEWMVTRAWRTPPPGARRRRGPGRLRGHLLHGGRHRDAAVEPAAHPRHPLHRLRR